MNSMIPHLSELGLNKYEAHTYIALIEEGVCSAKTVSDITGIPYGRVYETITSLLMKGFCITLPTKPMKCKAVPPEDVLEKVRESQDNKLSDIQDIFRKEFSSLHKQQDSASDKRVIWIINGRFNINKKIEALIRKAEKSICIFTSENGLKRLAFQKNTLKEAYEKGVNIKIASKKIKENEDDYELLNFCELHNITLNNKNVFISIDQKESMMVEPIPDDDDTVKGRDIGMWIVNEQFTRFIEDLLLTQFKDGKDSM